MSTRVPWDRSRLARDRALWRIPRRFLGALLWTGCVLAGNANRAPVARAGAEHNVAVGTVVALDGSGSTDADGDALTYLWSFASLPTGSAAALPNPAAVRPTFTADRAGAYRVQLVVSDGKSESKPSVVTVTAAAGNSAPVANAGAPQTVRTGARVALDGSGSADADGDRLTYQWAFTIVPSGSLAELSDAAAANPTFTADKAGSYLVQLVVSDGKVSSTPSTVAVTASSGNTAPVANAGAAQNVVAGARVTLDGSGSSDADGDRITYRWSLSHVPSGSAAALSDAAAVRPTFTADKAGSYGVQLVVSDGKLESDAATVTVTASAGNSGPVANAGAAQNVTAGALVALDGSGSCDADGDPLTYRWSFKSVPSGSAADLSDAAAVRPTFTADKAGSYVVQLVVSDGKVESSPSTVTLTAAAGNSAPVANSGTAQSVTAGAMVALDGSGSSDADGDRLTYRWSFKSVPGGSAAALSDASAVKPTFTADKAGSYVVQLVVSDGQVESSPSTVTIAAAAASETSTFIPTFSAFRAYLASATDTGADANNEFAAQTKVVSVSPIKFYNPAQGRLRLYNKDGGTTYAINYNGGIAATTPFSEGGTISIGSIDRYVSIPYAATPCPVTLRVIHTQSYPSGCKASQILILDATGKILKAASACDAASPTSVTFTDPANAELFIAYTRVTDVGGGLRVFQVDLTLTR